MLRLVPGSYPNHETKVTVLLKPPGDRDLYQSEDAALKGTLSLSLCNVSLRLSTPFKLLSWRTDKKQHTSLN